MMRTKHRECDARTLFAEYFWVVHEDRHGITLNPFPWEQRLVAPSRPAVALWLDRSWTSVIWPICTAPTGRICSSAAIPVFTSRASMDKN